MSKKFENVDDSVEDEEDFIGEIKNAKSRDNKKYKVKIWPEGEEDPKGYSIKGKSDSFKKAVDCIKKVLVKQTEKDFQEMKIEILDKRKIPYGNEADVRVSHDNNKGITVLKNFEGKKNKENTITVNKDKNSDTKFVKILAEKVIIPIVDKLIEGESLHEILRSSVVRKNVKMSQKSDSVVNSDSDKEYIDSPDELSDNDSEYKPEKMYTWKKHIKQRCSLCNKTFRTDSQLKKHDNKCHQLSRSFNEQLKSTSDKSELGGLGNEDKLENKMDTNDDEDVSKEIIETFRNTFSVENKKRKISFSDSEQLESSLFLRKVPNKYTHNFNDKNLDINDFSVFQDLGGGLCGANVAAAHCYGDVSMGRIVRRKVNLHKIAFWDLYKVEYVFPFTEMVGLKRTSFKTENDFLTFLSQNPNSDFLWMTHSDLQAISNMYNMNINILSVNVPVPGPHGSFARWTSLSPDRRIKFDIESRVNREDLFIYHHDDNHYDLLIQCKVSKGKGKENTEISNACEVPVSGVSVGVTRRAESDHLKGTGRVVREKRGMETGSDLASSYTSGTQLGKVKDVEDITEIKCLIDLVKKYKSDLQEKEKRIVTLENKVKELGGNPEDDDSNIESMLVGDDDGDMEAGDDISQEEHKLSCVICEESSRDKITLENHSKYHDTDGDWRCDGCSFQVNSKDALKKHVLLSHHTSTMLVDIRTIEQKDNSNKNENLNNFSCDRCEFITTDINDLQMHVNI